MSHCPDKEPWEEYPGVWATKAKFFAWLRGCFRKAIWMRYPGKVIFKNKICGPPPTGYQGKAKSGAFCALSGEWVGKSLLEIDHIKGEASLRDWSDVESFVRHLCATESNLQAVSKEAHRTKTYAERMNISYTEAVLEKQVLAFKKNSATKQKEILTELGIESIMLTTSEKRANAYREHLKRAI